MEERRKYKESIGDVRENITTNPWRIKTPGLINFREFIKLQNITWEERYLQKITDTIIFAEHPPTISLGSRNPEEQIRHIRVTEETLRTSGIPVIRTERGGSVTIHGPGILGCYVIADIGRLEFSTEFIFRLEHWIAASLDKLGIHTTRLPKEFRMDRETAKYEGLWINKKKIASMGIRISRHVTRFGVNICVCPEERFMHIINPCGIEEYEMSSLEKECGPIEIKQVISCLTDTAACLL